MPILDQLNEEMKTAMRAKDAARLGCIRQVKAKLLDATKAKGWQGEMDDARAQEIITSYVRSLQKGIEELGSGEQGRPLREQYQAEVDYLGKFLPQLLGEAETRKLVKDVLAAQGISDPKQTGRAMGAVMKDHKGKVDPALVKRLVEEALGG